MVQPEPDRALLVDGHSLVYRAFFALPPLSGGGEPTGAVHGFLNMLRRLLVEERPRYLAVAFDRGRPQFRLEVLPEYKAQREAAPDDLRRQVELLRQLLPGLHVPVVEQPGYEGDDLLGTLAEQLSARGVQVLLVSGDRDILQLVSERVTALITRKGISDLVRMGPREVEAEYGLPPHRLPEYKALAGDPSDNLPGVAGIGPKGARSLLAGVSRLEELLAGGGQATPRQRQALAAAGNSVLVQREVATIRRQVPLSVTLAELEYRPGLEPEADRELTRLEMVGLRERWRQGVVAAGGTAAVPAAPSSPAVVAGGDPGSVGLWPEVEGRAGRRRLVALHLAEGEGARHLLAPAPEAVRGELERAMAQGRLLSGYRLKELAACVGPEFLARARLWDLEVAAYLADPGRSRYTPEGLASRLGLELPEADRPESLARFCSQAASASRRELAEGGLLELAEGMEMPLVPILAAMEEQGLTVEPGELLRMNAELGERIAELEAAIVREAKGPFNVNSPRQLADVLFGRLGLPVVKRTKTGPSTDADVLAALEGRHPIIGLVLTHRQLVKLRSTYVEGLLALAGEQGGRVHTTFHQTVAATGRLSSSDPNLQNIPVRLEEGRRIRRAFVAAPGNLLLSADYSQIELRVLAHLSGDPALKAAFAAGEDVHRATAAAVFGVPPSEVTPEMRRRAKAVNFGIVYGISDFGLSRDLGIGVAEARAFIEAYFARHPGVKRYLEEAVSQARERGYAVTLFGRRRYLPELASRQQAARAFAERTAMNSPIQGTAADIIKRAMVALGPAPGPAGERLALQVHDELIVEVPEGGAAEAGRRLRAAMVGAAVLEVPLEVELKIGRSWYGVHPWDGQSPVEAAEGA